MKKYTTPKRPKSFMELAAEAAKKTKKPKPKPKKK
jgi:hypothetical protein